MHSRKRVWWFREEGRGKRGGEALYVKRWTHKEQRGDAMRRRRSQKRLFITTESGTRHNFGLRASVNVLPTTAVAFWSPCRDGALQSACLWHPPPSVAPVLVFRCSRFIDHVAHEQCLVLSTTFSKVSLCKV